MLKDIYGDDMRKLLAKGTLYSKKGFKKLVSEFRKTDYFSERAIVDYQNKKLQKLILHAYDNVPYYNRLFDKLHLKPYDIQTVEDLQKLPILNKSDIQNYIEDLKAINIDSFYKSNTSGSTGKPLTIYKNYDNKLVEMTLMARFNENIGYKIGENQIIFWGVHATEGFEGIKNYIKSILYNQLTINSYGLTDEILSEIAFKIYRNPNVNLRGYTSAIILLVKKMEELHLKTDIKSISVTAEQLFKHNRKIIEDHLGCNLYDQYGCGETNSIAFECDEHNGLHHAFEHSILEVLDDNNDPIEKGDVVITNLDNYAMPLIRYKNGDIVKLSSEKCACGRNSQLIEKIEGRSYDFIRGINGKILHGGFFDDVLLDSGFTEKCRIKDIQIVQTDADELTINYVTDITISNSEKDNLITTYQKYLGPMNIKFKKVDNISLSPAGKKKFVISLEHARNIGIV